MPNVSLRSSNMVQTVQSGDVRMVPDLSQAYGKVVEDSSDEQETQGVIDKRRMKVRVR